MTYDILSDTFCIYCQVDHKSPNKLQAHILRAHKGTYAANSVLEARAAVKATMAERKKARA